MGLVCRQSRGCRGPAREADPVRAGGGNGLDGKTPPVCAAHQRTRRHHAQPRGFHRAVCERAQGGGLIELSTPNLSSTLVPGIQLIL